jgi:hypothetical protein
VCAGAPQKFLGPLIAQRRADQNRHGAVLFHAGFSL